MGGTIKRFQEKWAPLFRQKERKQNAAFSAKADTTFHENAFGADGGCDNPN